MRRSWTSLLGLLVVLTPGGAHAGAEAPKPLFASHDLIHLTIRGPLNSIAAAAPTSTAPHDGVVIEDGPASAPLAVRLSARGINRRQRAVCSFPPLRLQFSDKPPGTSLFHGQKKLKLSTHCQSSAGFQQYTLLEYAGYRLFNVISPVSFGVRLARIDYLDPSGRPMTSRVGFFIEDVKDVARRNGLREAASGERVPATALQPRAAAQEALFEYMIANLDWAMNAGPPHTRCCHNTKLVGPEGAPAGLIPVPHDFDSSGLVNAPYAVPPEALSVSDVRERRYRGFCIHNAEAKAAAAEFLARRSALLAVFDGIPELDDRTRRNAVAYLARFFDEIGSENSLNRVLRACLA